MRLWVAVSLAVWSLLGAGTAQAGMLGTAGEFNAVVFENFSASGGDTEGRLAVGGNATIQSGYSVGYKLTGGPYVGRDVFVVGGSLSTSVNWQVFNGNTVYGGNYPSPHVTYASGSGYSSRKATAADGLPSLFNAMQSKSTALSENLRGLANNGSTKFEWGGLSATAGDSRLNIIQVNGNEWSNAHSFSINAPSGSTVILNISGKNLSLKGGLSLGRVLTADNIALGTRFLYNFYEAETLNLNGIEIFGSILAPKASLTLSGGAIDGTTIVRNATTLNGGEFHHYEFAGVPEPGSTALMLSGAAVFGLFVVRRRKAASQNHSSRAA